MEISSKSVAVIAIQEDKGEAEVYIEMLEQSQWRVEFLPIIAPYRWGAALRSATARASHKLDSPTATILILSEESITGLMNWEALLLDQFSGYDSLVLIGLLIDDIPREQLPDYLKDRCVDFSDLERTEEALDQLISRLENAQRAVPPIESDSQEMKDAVKQQLEGVLDGTTPQESSNTYACILRKDDREVVGTHTITSEFSALLQRAQKLHGVLKNSSPDREPEIAFTSLLFAFLALDTPIGRWFASFVKRTRVDVEVALRWIDQNTQALQQIAADTITLGNIALWPSMSVLHIFFEANTFAAGEPIDVRHMMAAIVYSANGHEQELDSWKFNREQWSNSFLGFMQRFYPEEAHIYQEEHEHKRSQQVFAELPKPVFSDLPKQPLQRGPSTHLHSDSSTTNDTLGYGAYAYAIYKFLAHKETGLPVTVSIQAPWGGGKTSLMRMIQQYFDPDAVPESMRAGNTMRRAEEETNHAEQDGKGDGDKRLTIRGVLDVLRDWVSGERGQKTMKMDKKPDKKVTVWFNAWKYESVNQVWAGLADAIMKQVTARMPVAEREQFWLRLHLERVGVEKIRQKIYEKIWAAIWRGAWWTVLSIVGAVLTWLFLLFQQWIPAATAVFGASATALAIAVLKTALATVKAKDEPADVSLNEYVSAPDYNAELGFVHHAECDLQRMFKCIPKQYKPLVIFIDDLDRCSPGNVAKVMEAVNLFLAGEFPGCIFVLGMDSELVAAALQAAHKDMIEALDNRAKTPVGWRFMDKFIQLPFIIPPCESDGIERYTAALFSSGDKKAKAEKQEKSVLPDNPIGALPEAGGQAVVSAAPAQTPEELRQVVQKKIDEGIASFSDDNENIKRYIAQGRAYFRGNPREMKRFANTFRFHYFLRWAREAQPDAESPTPEQVVRWTVLAMKWPEVARWLHSGFGTDTTAVDGAGDDRSGVRTRLQSIEQCSAVDSHEEWEAKMKKAFSLDEERELHWLRDGDLFRFFKKEAAMEDAESRLSAGAGKGLW